MQSVKKITINIPVKILEEAIKQTGTNITQTIIAGLIELEKKSKRSALRTLKGKINFELDLERTRR